jgi:hypothetical protein
MLQIADVDGGPLADETFDIVQGTGFGGLEERPLGGSERSGDSGAEGEDDETDDESESFHQSTIELI